MRRLYSTVADSIGFRIRQNQNVLPTPPLQSQTNFLLSLSLSFPQLKNGNNNSCFLGLL